MYWANDLSQWQLCDRISAKGHSLEIQDYTVDGACIPFSSGYFQIILVNTDGSRELVYTGALNCEAVYQWSIAPNPTASNFKLLGAIDHCVIYDGLGRLMGQYARALSDGVLEVDTSAWQMGFYWCQAFVGGYWQSGRIVVHRDWSCDGYPNDRVVCNEMVALKRSQRLAAAMMACYSLAQKKTRPLSSLRCGPCS